MTRLPNVVAEESLDDGRKILTFEVNGRRRDVVFGIARCSRLTPPGRLHQPRVRERDVRANTLLESLLEPGQLVDWQAQQRFWVETPRGPVELGHLYALRHHPDARPDREIILCVVPRDHQSLPQADIWANLLLVLQVCPKEFFDVAVRVADRPRP